MSFENTDFIETHMLSIRCQKNRSFMYIVHKPLISILKKSSCMWFYHENYQNMICLHFSALEGEILTAPFPRETSNIHSKLNSVECDTMTNNAQKSPVPPITHQIQHRQGDTSIAGQGQFLMLSYPPPPLPHLHGADWQLKGAPRISFLTKKIPHIVCLIGRLGKTGLSPCSSAASTLDWTNCRIS